ncbi:MAG TPA: tetratricopeptide repeat protein [Planktothrix sp.]|jgi:tetratricopeptide (TPR) repeat protein
MARREGWEPDKIRIMRLHRLLSGSIALSLSLTAGAAFASTDSQQQQMLNDAIQAYNTGHSDRAVELLTQVVKESQDNGTAHYYLGQALKKMGQSESAATQLELAAKICPPALLQSLAKQALDAADGKPSNQTPGPFGMPNLFGGFASGMMQFLPGDKKHSGTGTQLEKQDDSAFDLFHPDIFTPLKDSLKRGKQWVRERVAAANIQLPQMPGVNMQGKVVSMGSLMSMVDRSGASKWQSNPDGVVKFYQAPENSVEWDNWISAFRRNFKIILMRHLYREAGSEFGGVSKVVFSVDNKGNLRGRIVESSGDDVLNKCLIETIQALDHSPVLTFPPKSHCTGWNFSTAWDFAKPMAFVKYWKQWEKQKEDAQKAAQAAQVAQLETQARLKEQQKQKELKAKIAKLNERKKRLAAMAVKQDVSGQILPKAKPIELKAKALTWKDAPVGKDGRVPDGLGGMSVQDYNALVHGEDSDFSFMKRPELNRSDITPQTGQPAPQTPNEQAPGASAPSAAPPEKP